MTTLDSNGLVSVIVPSYNHEKYIEQCIESIVNQTYKNFELIVIDDGSIDNSPAILKGLQLKYNFRLDCQQNIGLSATLNKAIKNYAKGKYVTICSSDDYFTPTRLEEQVTFMEKHSEYPMSYGKTYVVDKNSKVLEAQTKSMNRKLKGGDIFKDLLTMSYTLPVTFMFKTSIFSEVGYYREDIWTEDYYMSLKVSSQYKVGFIDKFIYNYREIDHTGKALTLKPIKSVLKCINEYKNSQYYSLAIKNWHYAVFRFYASSKENKLFALMGFSRSLSYFYKIHFWIALAKLVLFWK